MFPKFKTATTRKDRRVCIYLDVPYEIFITLKIEHKPEVKIPLSCSEWLRDAINEKILRSTTQTKEGGANTAIIESGEGKK